MPAGFVLVATAGAVLAACGQAAPAAGPTTVSSVDPSPSQVVAVDGPSYDTLSALAARAGSVCVVTFLEVVESTTDGQVGGSTDPSGLPVQVWQVQTVQGVSGEATPSVSRLAILDPNVVSSYQDPVAVGD